jgi:hypothetical protein
VEGPGFAAVVSVPPPGVKRKPEEKPEKEPSDADEEDWGMFGSLMAEALEVDMEDEET